MPFDYEEALETGYNYEDILNHLSLQQDFDVDSARNAGYSDEEMVKHLSTKDYPLSEDYVQATSKVAPQYSEELTAMDRNQIIDFLGDLPSEISFELKREAIHKMRTRKYGAIKQDYPSFIRAVQNIPENFLDIINSFSSLIVGIPVIAYQHAKEVITRSGEKARLPVTTEEELRYMYRPYYVEERGKELYQGMKEEYQRFKENPLLTAGFFAEKHPLDALLIAGVGYSATGAALRAGGRAAGIGALTSRVRQPLNIANIVVERQFAKNPLTKAFVQKPFDAILNRYPQFKDALIRYKGGKLTTDMRNTYEELNFTERVKLHKEVYENIEKMSKKERDLMIPYLEGRLHFKKDLPGDIQGLVDMSKRPGAVEAEQYFRSGGAKSRWGRGSENINPQRIKEFEAYYKDFQKRIEQGFKLDEKITPKQLEDIIYQPIEIETGL